MEPSEASKEIDNKSDSFEIKGDGVRIVQIIEKEINFSDIRPGTKFRAWDIHGKAIRGPNKELYFEATDTVRMENQTFIADTKPLTERPSAKPDFKPLVAAAKKKK